MTTPEATPRTERPAQTMPDGSTVRPWGWFNDGPGSPYLATQYHGRIYVMGFARKGMNFAQPVFQVREDGEYGVMRTAAEIGPGWRKHPDAVLIVESVNNYDRLLRIEAAAREFREAQDADTGHPARDAARIFDAISALRAALDEESQP